MRWISPKELFAAGIGLLVGRALMQALPLLVETWRVPAAVILVADGLTALLLILAFSIQMANDERAVRAERERIAADLHDGLGFHLTTALSLAGNARETHSDAWMAVDLAIAELHSVIHFMHSESVPIVQTVGSVRYWLRKVVERKGLDLVWMVREDIPNDVLVGVPAYHFVKIFQEALSNVLQHAQATRLIVELSCPRQCLLLRIADNGLGIKPREPNAPGRGLEGMFRRARWLGGTLEIEPVPEGGTSVRLSIPLPCKGSRLPMR